MLNCVVMRLMVPSVQSELYKLYEAGVWLVGEHLSAHVRCRIDL